MTGSISLGDNYTLEEDSNGDLVITDADGTAVITLDNDADTVTIEDPTTFNGAITDAAGVSHSGELADQSELDSHSTQHEPGGSDEVTDIDIANSGTNVSSHASRHTADAADEVTVENLGTAGSNGTVPVSQGDGTLAMSTVGGNVPNWEEDANSPVSGSTTESVTITLSKTYDIVYTQFRIDTGGSGANAEVRVNGDTGTNYDEVQIDGTTNTDKSEVLLINSAPNTTIYGEFYFSGTFADNCTIWGDGNNPLNTTNMAQNGRNTSVTSPLNSITLGAFGGTLSQIDLRVYGITF